MIMNNKSKNNVKRKYKAFFIIISIVAIALTIMVNVIASQLENGYNIKLDLTETRLYSLSDQTENILEDLETKIYIYTLFEIGEEDMVIKEILEKYVAHSDSISLTNVDPTQKPGFTAPFDPDSKGISGGSVIITDAQNNRYKVLGFFDLYQSQYTNEGGLYVTGVKAEQSISSAINYIQTGINPRVMFLTGHGESTNVSGFLNTLTSQGYEVGDYSIFESTESLDPINDTLVIASPKQDISLDEYATLESFLLSGGNAMFFIDSVVFDATQGAVQLLKEPLDNFASLLLTYNVTINRDLIVGETASTTYQRKTSLLPEVGKHMITIPMLNANRIPIISDTSSITIPQRLSDTIKTTPLLTTGNPTFSKPVDNSLATIEKEDGDKQGPFNIAVLSEKANSQVIVFATSAIITSDDEYNLSGNKDIISASIAYLNNREDSIVITPKSMAGNVLQLKNSTQQMTLIIIVVVILPLSILAMGFMVWLKRKKL